MVSNVPEGNGYLFFSQHLHLNIPDLLAVKDSHIDRFADCKLEGPEIIKA